MSHTILIHLVGRGGEEESGRLAEAIPAYLGTFGGKVEVVARRVLRRVQSGETGGAVTALELRLDGESLVAEAQRLARLERFVKTTAKDVGAAGIAVEIFVSTAEDAK